MRRIAGIEGAARAEGARRGRRFEEALRAASRVAGAAAEARSPARGVAPRSSAASAPAARPRGGEESTEPRAVPGRGEVHAHGLPGPAPSPQDTTSSRSRPELRALARALPVAVETFGVRAGVPLALSLGAALDVELRSIPGGVELVLRPDARLARACAAGLPGLVAALGRSGIAVARADVRGRHPSGARPPFVDVPVPLR